MNEIDLALCRSAIYEALALGFRPPSRETVERLIGEDQNAALAQVAASLEATEARGKSASLAFHVGRLSRPTDLDALERSYRHLFGFTAHPKVPPHETEYGEETLFQQPQELADLSGFYRAFGLRVGASERVDHICCECEFLSFLTRKEAYALEQSEAEMLAATRGGQRLFLKDHLGRFLPAFAKLLRREDADGFYGRLGNLCQAFVRLEGTRFNVPFGLELLHLRPTEWSEEGFTCGSGEELVQITRPVKAATCSCNVRAFRESDME